MAWSLLFWAALGIPGYAALHRWSPRSTHGGFLGTISLCALATCVLLTPVSLVCYILRLPVIVFSTWCVVLVGLGLIDVVRRGWHRNIWKRSGQLVRAETLLIVADLVCSWRVGGYLYGDAWLHMTRIRFLLDHGFNNLVPIVKEAYFFPIYHTNLLHGLYAVCAQVTGCEPVEAWYAGLPVSKLLIASSFFHLGAVVFGRREPAWIMALFVVGFRSSINYSNYPNQLAPLWILPLVVALTVTACRRRTPYREGVGLALASVVLGQIHALYVLFASLASWSGLLAGVVGRTGRTDRRRRIALVGCAAFLLVGWPFPVISTLGRRGSEPQPVMTELSQGRFLDLGDQVRMFDPRHAIVNGLGLWLLGLLAVGVALSRCWPHHRTLWPVVGLTLVSAGILFVPPICGCALWATGRDWIVMRLNSLLLIGFVVLVVGLASALSRRRCGTGWKAALWGVAACAAGAGLDFFDAPERARPYYQSVIAERSERRSQLDQFLSLGTYLRNNIPKGETVLTDGLTAGLVVSLGDFFVVTAGGKVAGIWDQSRRLEELNTLLTPTTPWVRRRELLRRYGIRYFLVTGLTAPHVGWTSGRIARSVDGAGLRILQLRGD